MTIRLLTCYRCLTVQKESELLSCGKLKKLTKEESLKHKRCKNCKSRTFIN